MVAYALLSYVSAHGGEVMPHASPSSALAVRSHGAARRRFGHASVRASARHHNIHHPWSECTNPRACIAVRGRHSRCWCASNVYTWTHVCLLHLQIRWLGPCRVPLHGLVRLVACGGSTFTPGHADHGNPQVAMELPVEHGH